MALRQSNTDKVEDKLKPDFMKTDEERAQDKTAGALDTAASYLPGQSKPRDALADNARDPHLTHDAGRQGGMDAYKPAGEQTTGEWMKEKVDQGISHVQPNKSTGQEVRDTVTPGHHSEMTHDGRGLVDQVAAGVVGAKDAVASMFGGGQGSHTAPETR